MKYWECKFIDVTHGTYVEVRIETQSIPKKGSLKYLELIIEGNGEIDDDVTHCIGAG